MGGAALGGDVTASGPGVDANQRKTPRPGLHRAARRRGGTIDETALVTLLKVEAPGVEPGSASHPVGPLRA